LRGNIAVSTPPPGGFWFILKLAGKTNIDTWYRPFAELLEHNIIHISIASTSFFLNRQKLKKKKFERTQRYSRGHRTKTLQTADSAKKNVTVATPSKCTRHVTQCAYDTHSFTPHTPECPPF
jgi:hypothetical protein